MQLAVVVVAALPRAASASDILLYKEQRRGMARAATTTLHYSQVHPDELMGSCTWVGTAAARIDALISAFSVLQGAVWEYFSSRD